MDFIIERLDFIMTFITTTGFTNLLMFIILILLYRVVSIMEWSKVTLQEIEDQVKQMPIDTSSHNEPY